MSKRENNKKNGGKNKLQSSSKIQPIYTHIYIYIYFFLSTRFSKKKDHDTNCSYQLRLDMINGCQD